jgi:hypothetical protein
MAVDGGSAGVDPKMGRLVERLNDLNQQQRASNTGFVNGAAVLCAIPAINTSAGKIDAHVALLEFCDPSAGRETIPGHRAPGSSLRGAAKNGDCMSSCMEMACEDMSYLSAAAGYHDLHASRQIETSFNRSMYPCQFFQNHHERLLSCSASIRT